MLILIITSLILLLLINRISKNQRRLVLVTLGAIIVFEVLYQIAIVQNWGTLTLGSDESRYFAVVDDLSILSDNYFFTRGSSNAIYYLINYIFRITTFTDIEAILSIRINNGIFFLYCYVMVVLTINSLGIELQNVTVYDFLFLYNPFSWYMFSRNVRDVYILFLVIAIIYVVLNFQMNRLRSMITLILLVLILAMFRMIMVYMLFLAFLLAIIFKHRKSFNTKIFIVALLFIAVVSILLLRQQFTNTLLVVSNMTGYKMAGSVSISNIMGLLSHLVIRAINHIPFFVLEPTVLNFTDYIAKNDLSNIYTFIDYFFNYTQSLLNTLYLYPHTIAVVFGTEKKSMKVKQASNIYIIFASIVIVAYSSTIGSTDLRTKCFFIVPFIIYTWLNRNSARKKNYVNLHILTMVLLILITIVAYIL